MSRESDRIIFNLQPRLLLVKRQSGQVQQRSARELGAGPSLVSQSVAPVLDTGPISRLEGAAESLEGGSETCPGEARAPPPAGDTLSGV